MALFEWKVDASPVRNNKPRVSNISFGDGYEQRLKVGINTNPQVWTVSYKNRDQAEYLAIDAFLKARGGVESFDWIPPGEVTPLKFKCQDWQAVPLNGKIGSISGVFIQVFDP